MIKVGKTSALGIIFPNIYDKLVPELTGERLMGSVQFGARYRMIDFLLSGMVNSGIDNIAILCQKNYYSLLDHLGSGREWDLARKNGGLNIFPPFAENTMSGTYGGRVDAIDGIIGFLKGQPEEYVVMSDCNIAYNADFKAILSAHVASGADITMVYKCEEIPASAKAAEDHAKGMYYTFETAEDGTITKININPKDDGIQKCAMNVTVIAKDLLIKLVTQGALEGKTMFERDVVLPKLAELKVVGYEYTGYTARITDMKSYFDENMKLLADENIDALFASPVYTKVRDDNPTRYIGEASACNALIADGCEIEGTVENSILFRGVKVGKGAVVKNCILMQDTEIEAGADVEYLITDKNVVVTEGKEMKGTDTYPVFVAKRRTV